MLQYLRKYFINIKNEIPTTEYDMKYCFTAKVNLLTIPGTLKPPGAGWWYYRTENKIKTNI